VDVASEPIGYMVVSDSGDRIHFLDWGGAAGPGVVLVHGLSASAWAWTAVARRVAAAGRRTVAMDLRGHGLSDAPTATGAYDIDELAGDVCSDLLEDRFARFGRRVSWFAHARILSHRPQFSA